ncbi:hypothetical protein BCR36DRAFT_228820, partial [Piromyces finnis]
MILFDLNINDTNNGKIIGQTIYNCDYDVCTIPLIKAIGNPGDYKLTYKLKYFGNYEEFENSYGEIDLTIKECNDTYLYQDIEKEGFKS